MHSTEPETASVVAASVPAPQVKVIAKDSDSTLRRLTELTEKNAEATGLIASLRTELRTAERDATDLTRQINDLETELKRVIALGDTQKANHEAKLAQLRNQFEAQLSILRGELELAKTQVAPGDDEQRRRLEEARKRRQAQIESEALIYDGSEEENARAIRY